MKAPICWPYLPLLIPLLALLPAAAAYPQQEEASQETTREGEDGVAEGPEDQVGRDDDWHGLDEDPCSIDADGNWIDWMNRKVTKTVCGSARWFDNFFGTARGDVDRDATFGRLGLGAVWDEDDGWDSELRFRAKVHFPNMNNRLSAVVGRGDSDEILEEGGATVPPSDAFFEDETEWLVGLGYHLAKSDRNRLTLNVGTSFSDSSLDPYVRLRYIYNRPVFKASHFRLRLVPQWQDSKGAGYTAKASIDRSIGERLLFRWEVFGRDFQERFDGLSYGSNAQLFHRIGVGRAMRYLVGIWGQSGFIHQPEDWGAQITFRDSIYKETLFIEVLGGVNFRQRDEDPEREPKYLAGLVFELKFGR